MLFRRNHSKTLGGSSTRILALLLISCLVQCATGSCLSYGHSCWGAHGKRSGKPPAAAPDWYLARLLRQMLADQELNAVRVARDDGDRRAIYQVDAEDNSSENVKTGDLDLVPMDVPNIRRFSAEGPALPYDTLANSKLFQIMRAASENENK